MPRTEPPRLAEIADVPVRTEAEILDRVQSIVQQALRRELWFLLFDRRGCQVPLLVPMDIPPRPESQARPGFDPVDAIARFVDDLVDHGEASSVVVVYERPGAAGLQPEDAAWFEFLAKVAERTETTIRAVICVSGRRFRVIHHNGLTESSEGAPAA